MNVSDVDMLNAVKTVWADVSSVSPSSEQRLFVNDINIKINLNE